MFSDSRSYNRVLRIVTLVAVFASLNLTGLNVTVQSATTVHPNQLVRVSQDVLDRLGIQRPQARNLTELSLQVARQVQANGLPTSALSSQGPTSAVCPTI